MGFELALGTGLENYYINLIRLILSRDADIMRQKQQKKAEAAAAAGASGGAKK